MPGLFDSCSASCRKCRKKYCSGCCGGESSSNNVAAQQPHSSTPSSNGQPPISPTANREGDRRQTSRNAAADIKEDPLVVPPAINNDAIAAQKRLESSVVHTPLLEGNNIRLQAERDAAENRKAGNEINSARGSKASDFGNEPSKSKTDTVTSGQSGAGSPPLSPTNANVATTAAAANPNNTTAFGSPVRTQSTSALSGTGFGSTTMPALPVTGPILAAISGGGTGEESRLGSPLSTARGAGGTTEMDDVTNRLLATAAATNTATTTTNVTATVTPPNVVPSAPTP